MTQMQMDGREMQPLMSYADGMKPMNTRLALQNEHEMQIVGDDQQIMIVSLNHGEEILVEPGCMVWCDHGIKNNVSAGGMGNFLTRCCCMGEAGFRVHWQNEEEIPQKIGLTPSFPAKVVPVNLDQHSGELFIKRGAFMAATDPDLSFAIERAGRQSGGTFGKGLFGGQGFILTKVTGEGWVFLGAAGAIFERYLAEDETIVVDQCSVVAWETTVKFSYRMAGGAGMICCGGEGLTNTTLSGPGYVIIQSMPFEKVAVMVRTGGQNASGGTNPLAAFISLFVFIFIYFVIFSNFRSK